MSSLLDLLLQRITGTKQIQQPLLSPVPKGGLQAHNMPNSLPKPRSVVDIVNEIFPEDPRTARAVFTDESQLGKYPRNLQGLPMFGVAQINLNAHRKKIPGNSDEEKIEWLLDPENNLRLAREIYNASGWSPWESYTSGRYKKYY